jgi:hypothetical protein
MDALPHMSFPTYVPRKCNLNLSELGWQDMNLQHLDRPFLEEEIKTAIMSTPKEKALEPDGYIGLLFTKCWKIIPKKENHQRAIDYRHISLTYSFANIVSKLLATRLGPHLDLLISVNQTTFIRRRSIHDNFMYVQEVIKDLHKWRHYNKNLL